MKKTIPILLSAALLLSACGQAAGTAETTSAEAPAAVTETTAQTSAPKTTPGGVDKAETVYAKADADGTVTETTVEAVLKARDGATIEDVAALRDIINKEGDEAYTTGADNALTWENSGNAITYEGKSDAALPVTTRVTYYLNGVETAPADLAGQSGRVRIRFDYTNHTRETVTVDGQEYTVCVPFTAITAVILDGDKFSNIETDNGKVMELDGTTAVLGTAMPGLADSLRLTEFEPLEDTEIPAYFEVSADVTDFSLDFTATILTSSALDDMDTGDLSDLDDLSDTLDDLSGSASLSDERSRKASHSRRRSSEAGEATPKLSAPQMTRAAPPSPTSLPASASACSMQVSSEPGAITISVLCAEVFSSRRTISVRFLAESL